MYIQEYKIPQLTKITLTLTMGRTPRQRQLTGCRRRLPMRKVTLCSCVMHLSHAKVGFCDFLQSLFAVTCHSSRLAMQAILPILALSLYFTDWGDDNNNGGGNGGDGDDDAGRVTEALILLVVGGTPSRSVGCGGSSTLIIYTTIFLWLRRIITVSTTR